MKQKSIKNIMAVCMTMGILLYSSLTAMAIEYVQESGSAGSVSVIVEAGYNGRTAYSYVSASDYVDADMSGFARYYGSNGGMSLSFEGGFDEQTYGRLERSCEGNVVSIFCAFVVISADGRYENMLSTM